MQTPTQITYMSVPSFMLKHDVASAAANPLVFASITMLIGFVLPSLLLGRALYLLLACQL